MKKEVSKYEIAKFKEGILKLGTNFGELAQIMIEKKYKYKNSDNKYYDLKNGIERIEVKFSRALEKEMAIKCENAIEICKKAAKSERWISSKETTCKKFDCNIQQIKITEFDTLYYGIFFADKIEIFKVEANKIKDMPLYSSKQHKGNKGEGQFHIKSKNIEFHRKKYLKDIINYEALYKLLS